ncbi:MAG: PilN domain-containing protein [Acidobacteriota bacterium]|nr:PilN domain-containing protein [Acidobacteriota bacterium]
MRYQINLASRPYIDARRFYTNWLAGLGALFLLAALLVGLALHALVGSRQVAGEVRKIKAQIAKLDEQRARAEEVMNRPENRDVRERSRFLNGTIARKAFSWTQVFEELERVVPPRVHVLSIHPEVKNDQVQLVMRVAGDSRASVVELLRRMEGSQSFRNPQLRAEDVRQTSNGGAQVEFEISAQYVPQVYAPKVAPPIAAARGGD